jgi:hypothetical protein
MPASDTQPKHPRNSRSAPPLNPYYGHGYRPDWPSILSVAHDVADGGALYVVTDRPCTLAGPTLPLAVAGKGVIGAATVLPVKFRLAMSGAIPRDAAWVWGTGPCQLTDPVSGHAPNWASGNCADIPGPYTPPPPANVVGTSYGTSGTAGWAELTFDRAVILSGGPPDSTILFAGVYAATAASAVSLVTLRFELPMAMSPGGAWAIGGQPSWIDSPLTWPAAGTF